MLFRSRCYVLRADIDLASLVGQTGRPVGAPDDGTYWLDTTTTTWGIYEFNATTGAYTVKQPLVLSDAAYISGDVPLASLGNIGDYAVNALQMMDEPSMDSSGQFFYKGASNTWIKVGSADWMAEWPTIQGSNSNPSLTAGDTFNINFNGDFTVSIAVPAGPNNNVAGVANAINTKGYGGLSAAVVDGKLCVYSTQNAISNSAANYITISAGSGTVLTNLGITAKTYYQPALFYGSSAQQPLWQAGQSQPRPTGSVWIKVGSAGSGLNPVMSVYNATIAAWSAKSVTLATSDTSATAGLDATGGQAIQIGRAHV